MIHRAFVGMLGLVALTVVTAAGHQEAPPSVVCELSPWDGGEMAGGCRSSGNDIGAMKLFEGGDGGTSIWVGTLTMQGFEVDVDIKPIEYAAGPVLALRTPFGWFPTTLWRDGDRLFVRFEESELPPSAVDLRIVQAARRILDHEAAWDRRDDRICEAADTSFSLYCAMHRATIEVTGEFHHRQPALQSVRFVVQAVWSARYSDHRLMDFNNHPETTLADVHATLAEAEGRIRESLTGMVRAPVLPESGGGRPPVQEQADSLPESMFGFNVGEERRYTLGPPEALVAGEHFEWMITLADISMNGGRLFAAFDLGFEVRTFGGADFGTVYGRSLRARLIVNDDGFPGLLTVREQMNDAVVTTEYTLQDDETYQMTIDWPENEYTFDIPLASHRNLDLDTQRGLYLFANGRDLRGVPRFDLTDTIFANPGLLSLALPWPPAVDGWEREALGFTPTDGMFRYPNGELLQTLGNRGVARRQNFTRLRLDVGFLEEVEIGGRTVEAFKLDVRGQFRDAYVDRLGRVVLLELEARHRGRLTYIRLLWPSEY